MKVDLSASEIMERKADDRGRINLGMEMANKTVEVAIIDTDE